MDDLGINKWLEENYGKTVDGHPLFRLKWSDKTYREMRKSRFIDFSDNLQIRDVVETRSVPKYPFAQNRWVLERIHLIPDAARDAGLQTDLQFSYEEIYTFQDRDGKALELSREKVEQAMYLFFKFYLLMSHNERVDMRMRMLAQRELERKQKIKESLGEGRSPFGFVLE